MKKEFLIKSLNMESEEVLTLEKAEDRMEFQAMLFPDGEVLADCSNVWNVCPQYVACPSDCPTPPPPSPG
jgi:hypothetical protein